jgi:hypothetical protein
MFGSLAGTRYDVPIAELLALAESAPADTGNYRSRVVAAQQTGDAAVAVVAEEGYWGDCLLRRLPPVRAHRWDLEDRLQAAHHYWATVPGLVIHAARSADYRSSRHSTSSRGSPSILASYRTDVR